MLRRHLLCALWVEKWPSTAHMKIGGIYYAYCFSSVNSLHTQNLLKIRVWIWYTDLVLFCQCLTHLWLYDSKQVPPNDKLLGKAVVLIRLEGNAKEAHNAGVAG